MSARWLVSVQEGGKGREQRVTVPASLELAPHASLPRAWLCCASQLTGGLCLCFLQTEGLWPPTSHMSLAPFSHSICSLDVCITFWQFSVSDFIIIFVMVIGDQGSLIVLLTCCRLKWWLFKNTSLLKMANIFSNKYFKIKVCILFL